MSKFTSILQIIVIIVLAVNLSHSSVEAFVRISPTSVTSGTLSVCHDFVACLNRRQKAKASSMRLSTYRHRQVTIRDWRSSGEESQKIYDFLLQQEEQQQLSNTDNYDPEGSLVLDMLNSSILQESYSKEDGGCFLVAAQNEDERHDANNIMIVGTLGMIVGTQISYQSSGSSFSKPGITGAIRRVCASWPDDVENDSPCEGNRDSADKQNLSKISTTKILEDLILRGEQQALQIGVTDLIGLAYPEAASDGEKSKNIIVKPTRIIFESLGYRKSKQQLPGVSTIQYEKELSKDQIIPLSREIRTVADSQEMTEEDKTNDITPSAPRERIFIILATIISILILGVLVFNLYSTVFGIEQLWGSIDNGGIGTSLSTENLKELLRNEELGRSTAAKNIGDGIVIKGEAMRQWEDQSFEELREEQALMKIIQGQTIRLK